MGKAAWLRTIELAGDDIATVVDPHAGWPGHARIKTDGSWIDVSLHASTVGSMSRKPNERRFQNPSSGSPIALLPGTSIAIALGVFEDVNPVLVAPDAAKRIDLMTRFSVLFPDSLLVNAQREGWSRFVNSTGEEILAFHPRLLPELVAMRQTGVAPASELIVSSVAGSGLMTAATEPELADSAERARRAVHSLVRQAGFSHSVRKAYDNRCAACGIGLGLVVGAHIYPAAAPRSQDRVWNGIAMCENHHRLFDLHLLWVDPVSLAIRLHPDVHEASDSDIATALLIESTADKLRVPGAPSAHPKAAMFEMRYAFFAKSYDWARS